MNAIDKATRIANKLQNDEDLPMNAILEWFNDYKPFGDIEKKRKADQFALFYSDSPASNSWTFYCNAPDYQTVLRDMLAEIPSNVELQNKEANTFVAGKFDPAIRNSYWREWRIVKL